MEVPNLLSTELFKRPKTNDEILTAKKLACPLPDSATPDGSQELFTEECVPNNETECTLKNEGFSSPIEDVIIEKEIPMEELEDYNNIVPTLEEDYQDILYQYENNKSILKSPNTPEPFFPQNEDSMGFNGLAVLNFDTPTIEPTQSLVNINAGKPSPIKRKIRNTEPCEEPLNSTQTFFDLTRHHKILSNERKKILFGGGKLPGEKEEENVEEGGQNQSSNPKPVRRKLFDKPEERQNDASTDAGRDVTAGDASDGGPLESFEEAWDKVSILKKNCEKSKPSINPFVLKRANLKNTNKDKPAVPGTLHDESSVPESSVFKTPAPAGGGCDEEAGVSACNMVTPDDMVTPDEVLHVVETVEIETNPKPHQEEERISREEDETKMEVEVHQETGKTVDVKSLGSNDCASRNPERMPLSGAEPATDKLSAVPTTNNGEDIDKENIPQNQQRCKRKFIARPGFNEENRIYKKSRSEDAVNCPELVQQLFRVTDVPAQTALMPAYPPAITKVVPIPIPDTPRRRKTGLSRRSTRVSLHPYIVRQTTIVHEE